MKNQKTKKQDNKLKDSGISLKLLKNKKINFKKSDRTFKTVSSFNLEENNNKEEELKSVVVSDEIKSKVSKNKDVKLMGKISSEKQRLDLLKLKILENKRIQNFSKSDLELKNLEKENYKNKLLDIYAFDFPGEKKTKEQKDYQENIFNNNEGLKNTSYNNFSFDEKALEERIEKNLIEEKNKYLDKETESIKIEDLFKDDFNTDIKKDFFSFPKNNILRTKEETKIEKTLEQVIKESFGEATGQYDFGDFKTREELFNLSNSFKDKTIEINLNKNNSQINNNHNYKNTNGINEYNYQQNNNFNNGEIVKKQSWENVTKNNKNEIYELPSVLLFEENKNQIFDSRNQKEEIKDTTIILENLFLNFGINANVVSFQMGPTLTTYEIFLQPGTKISKFKNLEDNIKLSLGLKELRMQTPIPGKNLIGLEIPNKNKQVVSFKDIFYKQNYEKLIVPNNEENIRIYFGQDVYGKPMVFDLNETPHLLIAGSTGSGKSVAINIIIISILMHFKPNELSLILIDPKMVEFMPYRGLPHLSSPIITSPEKTDIALKQLVDEMEKRYRILSSNLCKNIYEFNKKNPSKKLPFIVVIVDELADLMMSNGKIAKEIENSITRITQKARAAGIHMILATQRPSVNVITGVIKSNIPSRIAFSVASSVDSRTIIDQVGAEKLLGKGDMLVSLYGQQPQRGQCAWISNEENSNVINHIEKQKKINSKFYLDIKESESLVNKNKINFTSEDFLSIHHPWILKISVEICKLNGLRPEIVSKILNINEEKSLLVCESLVYLNIMYKKGEGDYYPEQNFCKKN